MTGVRGTGVRPGTSQSRAGQSRAGQLICRSLLGDCANWEVGGNHPPGEGRPEGSGAEVVPPGLMAGLGTGGQQVGVNSELRWRQPQLRSASDVARRAFEEFFESHQASLGRFAFLLTGNVTAAEDLTADVFLAVWRRWDTVSSVEAPLAYVRRMMVNMAASGTRRMIREQRRVTLLQAGEFEAVRDPDGAVSVDVRAALLRLPVRRRACVVLRHGFDLSEAETAEALGVSVGTVKSQTSKGVAQLQKLLSAQERWSA